jgi:YidC/Oxa1 family membrane protein insertase
MAGQAMERQFVLFAGPKEYRTLGKVEAEFRNRFDRAMGFDTGFGGAFFGFFSKALLVSMNGLNALGLSYALAIITITVIIKLIFWPLTQASTRSMKRMQALQPQMKAIQEKFKDDPAKMNRKVMEFMKENKVSPLGGCLPLLLQIPVFIGFFKMVQTAIELRGASFLWACDLSRPDTVFVIPGIDFNVNPLPLLMGGTMLWQASLTPVSPGMDPAQQKIMKYMPLIFLFMLYNYSAGLTLYWTVQNLLSIAQMKLTKTVDTKPATPAAVAPVVHTVPRKKKK